LTFTLKSEYRLTDRG